MNERDKEELREISTVVLAAEHRAILAYDSLKTGQSVVANTSIEQFKAMMNRIQQKLKNLYEVK